MYLRFNNGVNSLEPDTLYQEKIYWVRVKFLLTHFYTKDLIESTFSENNCITAFILSALTYSLQPDGVCGSGERTRWAPRQRRRSTLPQNGHSAVSLHTHLVEGILPSFLVTTLHFSASWIPWCAVLDSMMWGVRLSPSTHWKAPMQSPLASR